MRGVEGGNAQAGGEATNAGFILSLAGRVGEGAAGSLQGDLGPKQRPRRGGAL